MEAVTKHHHLSEPKNMTLMTEGSVLRNLLFFSIPLLLGNLLQQTYNAVDSIIVGNYVGSNALAAVGSGTFLINLLIAFSQGASVGAGVIIAQYLGAKEERKVGTAVHTALAIAVLLGLLLTVGGVFGSRSLLVWMHTPEEVMEPAVSYLRIYSGGMLFNVVYNMAAGILNAAGNSRRSLLYLGAAALVNIVMDILLIPVLHLGVAGAAIATDLSQVISCVLALSFLMRVPTAYQVRLKDIRVEKNMARRMIRVGLPTGIQNMVISLSNILVQSGVNRFGATAMAGFGAYMKIDGFNILPVTSFGMAITTFVGQNCGAGKMDRVKKGIRVTVLLGIVYTVLTGCLLLYASYPVMYLFSHDAEVIAYGQTAMHYFCPMYWLLGILQTLAGAVRGTGRSLPPTIILLISLCAFRVFWVQLILPRFASLEGIFLLYPVSWLLGAVLMGLYAWKGDWMKRPN